jgi:hypothetical protein
VIKNNISVCLAILTVIPIVIDLSISGHEFAPLNILEISGIFCLCDSVESTDMEERSGGWVYIYRGTGLDVKKSGGRVSIYRGTGFNICN